MTLEVDAPVARKLPFFMRGNYAPVADEVTLTGLEVEGRVPDGLNGLYLRNGPNPSPGKTPGHWFMGDGMLHGLKLGDGKAHWYRNRWVQTKARAGEKSMREDYSRDYTVGVANTHVVPHNGNIYALVESSVPTRISPELETLGLETFGGKLDFSFTAHPKICPVTGEMHAFGYAFAPPYLVYHRIGADGSYLQREEIAVTGPTMIHDFAITRDHVIFMDLPVVFDLEIAIKGGMPYAFSDSYPARLGILKRGAPASETRWVSVKPCYVFHVANAYEEADGTIVIDVARYDELWRRGTKKNFDPSRLWRWTVKPGASAADEMALDDRAMEFPRIDERLTGLPHRYAYAPVGGAFATEKEEKFKALARVDHKTGMRAQRSFGAGAVVSEFVHVPKSAQSSESNAWLMGFVFDESRGESDFHILDAETLEPAAVVQLRRRVPQGFHGSWVPET
jgi:carotenoid cleavage dioxygenase-like enzyme